MPASSLTTPSYNESVLQIFTNDVAKFSLMTDAEEQAVGARALAGDERAQHILVERNLRFVIAVSKKYRNHGVEMLDLIQAGNWGLWTAAKKFNPQMGVRFVAYAVWWVQQMITKEIDSQNGSVRPTQTQAVRNRRVYKLQQRAIQEIGRPYTIEELMERTKYTEDRIIEALSTRISIKSLDEPVNPSLGDGNMTFAQIIGADDDSEEVKWERRAKREFVEKLMEDAKLLPRERTVLRKYYGIKLEGGEQRAQSLTQIGKSENVSRERARQLKERALMKIGRFVAAHPEVRNDVAQIFTTAADMDERQSRLQALDQDRARITGQPIYASADVLVEEVAGEVRAALLADPMAADRAVTASVASLEALRDQEEIESVGRMHDGRPLPSVPVLDEDEAEAEGEGFVPAGVAGWTLPEVGATASRGHTDNARIAETLDPIALVRMERAKRRARLLAAATAPAALDAPLGLPPELDDDDVEAPRARSTTAMDSAVLQAIADELRGEGEELDLEEAGRLMATLREDRSMSAGIDGVPILDEEEMDEAPASLTRAEYAHERTIVDAIDLAGGQEVLDQDETPAPRASRRAAPRRSRSKGPSAVLETVGASEPTEE